MTKWDFGGMCLLALLGGGLVLIWVGARAGGLAMLGAFAGGIWGFQSTSILDEVPPAMLVEATIGCVVGGIAGLSWKSRARRKTLATLGVFVAVFGIVGGLLFNHLWAGAEWWDGTKQVLVPFDAAFVALLCFVQPRVGGIAGETQGEPGGLPVPRSQGSNLS